MGRYNMQKTEPENMMLDIKTNEKNKYYLINCNALSISNDGRMGYKMKRT